MLIGLLIDLILGALLLESLRRFYNYFWFIPSPVNGALIKAIFDRENYNSRCSPFFYVGYALFVVISLGLQVAIASACVALKQLLASPVSLLDASVICVIPAFYKLCDDSFNFWIDYTGRRIIDFPIGLGTALYPGSGEAGSVDSLSVPRQQNPDFQMKLDENSIPPTYKISRKVVLPKDVIVMGFAEEISSSVALLIICLAGGLTGYFLLALTK